MTIIVKCKCGKSYKVKDDYAGQKTNCPSCGKPLYIPIGENFGRVLPKQRPAVEPSSSIEQQTAGVIPSEQAQPVDSTRADKSTAESAPSWQLPIAKDNTIVLKQGVSYLEKAAKSRRLGIWGVVLFFTCIGTPVSVVLCPIAFSLGCVAISGMRRSGNFTGKGKAITGIVIGLIFYILLVIAAPVNSVFFDHKFDLFSWLASVLLFTHLTAAIWIGLDSSELMRNITKEERKQIGGAIARSPAGWVVACTSLGIIGWWLYMAKRQDYIDFEIQKRARQEAKNVKQ